jgi:hypothetical protein
MRRHRLRTGRGPSAAGLLVLLGALVTLGSAPRPAAARMQLTVEMGPGVSIPLSTYINAESPKGFNRLDNGLHAAFNLTVLFDSWSFRYQINWLGIDHSAYRLPDDSVQNLRLAGLLTGNDELANLAQEGEASLDETLAFHSATFGYRFYLLRGTWQPYIPVDLGAVFVSGTPLSRTLFGATLSAGFGLDVRLWRFLYAGLSVRYQFYITELDQNAGLAGFLASKDLYSSAYAMAHILSTTAHIQARF